MSPHWQPGRPRPLRGCCCLRRAQSALETAVCACVVELGKENELSFVAARGRGAEAFRRESCVAFFKFNILIVVVTTTPVPVLSYGGPSRESHSNPLSRSRTTHLVASLAGRRAAALLLLALLLLLLLQHRRRHRRVVFHIERRRESVCVLALFLFFCFGGGCRAVSQSPEIEVRETRARDRESARRKRKRVSSVAFLL